MVIGVVMALAAHGACTVGTDEVPPLCPVRLPAIRGITIERSGYRAYPEDDARIACATFKPSVAKVRQFLTQAKRVDPAAADATLDRSPCQASGSVTFADNSKGRWTIEQLRVGRIVRRNAVTLLYCPTCRSRPFRW